VPLTKIQSDILTLLADQRGPDSYIAGATPLTRIDTRISADIDVFFDSAEQVFATALQDADRLRTAGYEVRWLRQMPNLCSAAIIRGKDETRLEWAADSDFRFFPILRSEAFGYTLHPVDLAMNKVMAAAGRREVRDLVDLVTINDKILPLGGVIWAAVEKSPGFTPDGLIAEIRRNSHYPAAEWKAVYTSVPLDPAQTLARLRMALDAAEEFVSQMPSSKAGLLFLENGKVVQPDPSRLDSYQTHAGQRRGHWPTSPEIANAMFDHYRQKD
jgi:hypothetical protein